MYSASPLAVDAKVACTAPTAAHALVKTRKCLCSMLDLASSRSPRLCTDAQYNAQFNTRRYTLVYYASYNTIKISIRKTPSNAPLCVAARVITISKSASSSLARSSKPEVVDNDKPNNNLCESVIIEQQDSVSNAP
jgi:hypothetical protein